MRFFEYSNQQGKILLEAYTVGDIAETIWGAAMTAAFEKYPNKATVSDVDRVLSNLDGNLGYKAEPRPDGGNSSLSDTIEFVNLINYRQHIEDIKNWSKTSQREPIPKVMNICTDDANKRVAQEVLDLKDIFSNGKADKIVIGAQGGADQKGTKVDVSIVHTAQGVKNTTDIGFSLKTNLANQSFMPAGQHPVVPKPKGSGKGLVSFFNDLGVIKGIDEASYEAYVKIDDALKRQASGEAIEEYVDRKVNEISNTWNKNLAVATKQINSRVDSEGDEVDLINNIANFLDIHINKGRSNLKYLTIEKDNVSVATLEKFKENVDKFELSAEHQEGSYAMVIYANQDPLLKVRLAVSGGQGSAKDPSKYRQLRYKIYVETGPAYKKYGSED